MSGGSADDGMRGLAGDRLVIVVVAPVLFTVFGVFVPIATSAGFSVGFQIGCALLLAVAGGVTYAVNRHLDKTGSNGAIVQFREFAVLLVGCALIAWALLRLPFTELVRSGEFWTTLLLSALVWFVVARFQRDSAKRLFFLRAVIRSVTTERRTGPRALADATRDFSSEAGEADESMRRTRGRLILILLWFGAVLVLKGWILQAITPFEELSLTASTIVVLYAVLVIGHLREDHRLLAVGLRPSHEGVTVETVTSFGLFVLIGLISLLLAVHSALLSQSTLAAIMAWLAALLARIFSGKPVSFTPPPPARRPLSGWPGALQSIGQLPSPHRSRLLGMILTYLGWVLLAALVAVLLWMLFAPIFRAHFRRRGLARALRTTWAALVAALARAVTRPRELGAACASLRGRRARSYGRTDVKTRKRGRRRISTWHRSRWIAALIGSGARRFPRAFIRLTKWGERHGVPFSTSLGPREYVEQVGLRMPMLQEELVEIAQLYERGLFAHEPLSAAQVARYYEMIGRIVRSG